MNTQLGETISAEQFNQTYPVGTTLSKEEFSSQYGTKPREIKKREDLLSGIPGMVLGTAGNTVKDIVQGVTAPGLLNKADEQGKQAEQLEQQAMQTQDMTQRKALLQQANQYRMGASEIAANTASNFSPDVQQDPLTRSVQSAAQVATLPSLVKSIPKVLSSVRHPIQALGELRGNILNKSPIATDELLKIEPKLAEDIFYKSAPGLSQKEARSALLKLLGNVNPLDPKGKEIVKVSLDKVYENLGALEKMGKAYGRSGDAGSSAISQGTNIVSHVVREFAKDASPEAAKNITGIMQALYTLGKNTPKLLARAGITGGVLGGIYGLSQLMGKLGGSGTSVSTGTYRQ